jgi:YD repeat-containing protein
MRNDIHHNFSNSFSACFKPLRRDNPRSTGITIASLIRAAVLVTLSLLWLGIVQGQSPVGNKTTTAGWTPLAEQPGAPVGSYPLSGFDNVNLFNGHLNFHLPLLHIGGRGSTGYTMTLPIEQHWNVQTIPIPHCDMNGCTYDPADYRHIANPVWWTGGLLPGYGPGVMVGRQSGANLFSVEGCASGVVFDKTLTRLTFTGPDGTEYEFRDAGTGGEPKSGGPPGCFEGFNRGKVWTTADGSAATFVSENDIKDYRQPPSANATLLLPTGYMLLRDGTRYRIENGVTKWIRDANGNKTNFTYGAAGEVVGIDDSLNRHVSISYGNSNNPDNPDVITFKGAGGITRQIKIHHALQHMVLRTHLDGSAEYTIKTFHELFGLQNSQDGNCDLPVVAAVELPDGRQYQFRYDSHANLAQVILPTGGRIEYDWHTSPYNIGEVYGIYGRVLERRTAVDATTSIYEKRTTYLYEPGVVTVDNLDPKDENALRGRSKHHFHGNPIPDLQAKGTDYPKWQDGQEFKTELYALDGTTLLRTATKNFQQRASVSWWTGSANDSPANDPRLVETTTTLVDTNQVAKTSSINPNNSSDVGFDQYNNQTDVWEYDYGATTPLRHTHTTYLNSGYDTLNPIWSAPNLSSTYHLRSLPTQVSVFDGGGIERARMTLEYDNYSGSNCDTSNHCGLLSRSDVSGFDATLGSAYTNRGNVTAVTNYFLAQDGSVTGSISTYSQYDIAGNVLATIDVRGNRTKLFYEDCYGSQDADARQSTAPSALSDAGQSSYAFATKMTNALGQSVYAQFDYYLGKPIEMEDLNGVVSSVYFDDVLDRPTKLISAANKTDFRSVVSG